MRIARGITIGEVADRLLLSPRQVEALEDGDTPVFQSSSYYLTALRRYATFAEIDPNLVAKVGEAMRVSTAPPAIRSARPLALAAAVLMAVTVLGAAVWWMVRTPAPAPAAPPDSNAAVAPIPTIVFSQEPSTPSVSFGAPTVAASSGTTEKVGGEPAAPLPSGDVASPQTKTEPSVVMPAPSRASTTAPAVVKPQVPRPPRPFGAFGAVRVHDATWVLVRDANDSVVGRTLPADGAFPLESAPTYLAVGTPNVDLFVGSRRVDIADYVVNGQVEMRTHDFAALAERDRARTSNERR